jgi:prevent-host-death family protein
MPDIVNVHAAKTHFSELLARVEQGEEVIIGRAGKPVAKIVKYERPPLRFGALEGQIWIADDFDESDEEIIAAFEGKYSNDVE